MTLNTNSDGTVPVTRTRDDALHRPFHALPPFCPEMQLMLSCGGPALRERTQFGSLLEDELDWELVSRLATWHRLVPLLYWNLSHSGQEQVPDGVMESLKILFSRSVERSLRFTSELLMILGTFEDRGIKAVPYKGPVLASRLYGNVALRLCSDLDILVRRSDVEKAREVLLDRGYEPWKALEAANHRFQLESRYSERFDRLDSTVELHWAFTNKDVAFPLSLEDFLPRLQEYVIGGTRLAVFSPADLLLTLTVHGAKHFWNRLEWLCGVAELLSMEEELDWDELLTRAKAARSERKLLLGLALAHDLYGVSLPPAVVQRIREDSRIPQLATQVTNFLFDGLRNTQGVESFGRLEHDLFHFMLGDHLRDRLRYLGYRMTTPSRPERWSTVSIRGRPLSIHAFTRPFTVMGKLIPALWKSVHVRRET